MVRLQNNEFTVTYTWHAIFLKKHAVGELVLFCYMSCHQALIFSLRLHNMDFFLVTPVHARGSASYSML